LESRNACDEVTAPQKRESVSLGSRVFRTSINIGLASLDQSKQFVFWGLAVAAIQWMIKSWAVFNTGGATPQHQLMKHSSLPLVMKPGSQALDSKWASCASIFTDRHTVLYYHQGDPYRLTLTKVLTQRSAHWTAITVERFQALMRPAPYYQDQP
jgi:hypothetical protein